MTTRRLYGLGAVLLTAGLLGACSSEGATGGSSTAQQPGATEVLPPDATVTSGATPTADDLCTVIPDLATKTVWFLTGSQDLYGEETLRQVAEQSREVAENVRNLRGEVVLPGVGHIFPLEDVDATNTALHEFFAK